MRSPSKSKPGLESDFKQEKTKILVSDEDVSQNDLSDIYEDSSNEVSIDTSDTSDNEECSEKGIIGKKRDSLLKFGLPESNKKIDLKQEKNKIFMSDEDVSQDDTNGIYVDSSYEVSIDTSDTSDNEKSSEKGKWYDNWRDINGGFGGCLVVLTSWSFNWTVGKYDQTTYSFGPLTHYMYLQRTKNSDTHFKKIIKEKQYPLLSLGFQFVVLSATYLKLHKVFLSHRVCNWAIFIMHFTFDSLFTSLLYFLEVANFIKY